MTRYDRYLRAAGFLIGFILVFVAAAAEAAPKAKAWDRWTAHDPASAVTVDHSAWDLFLKRYVIEGEGGGLNRVRYGDVSEADRAALDAYLQQLSATDVDALNRAEQKAFWINAYNALTVDLIIDNYPVSSIRKIGGGLFSPGPWKQEIFTVAGEQLTLDDIEHRILRPIWQDPLIHYGVNCASVGCPNLIAEAFTARNTDRLLERNARDYVNSDRGVLRVKSNGVVVSSIYDWFKEDFGGSEKGVLAHLKAYAEPALAERIEAAGDIDGDDYDWSLNDAAAAVN